MKKLFFIVLGLFLFLGISQNQQAQIKLQFGIGGEYVIPMSDFGGEVADFYNGTAYGESGGIGFSGKARVGILGFGVVAGISYFTLSNNGTLNAANETIEVEHSVFSIKIGPEYMLDLPLVPVKPYFGIHASLNTFSGESTLKGISGVSADLNTLESTSRIGLGASGGAVISLGVVTIDIGLQYNMLNLFGKEFVTVASPDRNDSYINLSDAADPLYNAASNAHFVEKDREISTFTISGTIMIGI
ncbi:MAG: hypothetical protein JW866_06985 [Ignavibacteriales bacterium]|nr:hypothetical protein [Ignavibacteriales bacterium]